MLVQASYNLIASVMSETPEARARRKIDQLLIDAGWFVQSREDVNLAVGRGVAIREFPMKPGFGLNKSVCHLHCCHLANLV